MRLCLQSQEGGNFERKEGRTSAVKKKKKKKSTVTDKELGSSLVEMHRNIVYMSQIINLALFYSKKRGVSGYFSHIKVGTVQTLLSGSLFTGFYWFVVLPILSLQDKNKLSAHSLS